MEEVKMDICKELTIIEEIEALPIEEKIKERIISKVSKQNSNYTNTRNELNECYYEIDRLEKAIIYLSKEVASKD